MKIPNFINNKFVDENGMLTETWRMILNILFDQMQKNVSEEGFVIPSMTEENIALLINSVNGTLIYDKTNNLLKIKENGIFKTISTI